MDIKNTKEVLKLLKDAAVVAKEVIADGKVNVFDLPKLAALWGPAKDAIEGIDQVPLEVKDIDAKEVQEALVAAVDVIQAWAAVFGKAPLVAKAA